MTKKSQVWTLDMITGVVLFLTVMVMYFLFSSNFLQSQDATFTDIYRSLEIVSGSLMTEGVPSNWTAGDIREIGITNGNYRLHVSKLSSLANMNYSTSKLLLKTQYDYLLFFENKSDDVMMLAGQPYFGKPGVTKDNIEQLEQPDTLLLAKRLLIHNSEIITMVVYLWE